MNKYDKWLNTPGTIMYYFTFSFIKDKTGRAVYVNANIKDNKITDYSIIGNGDLDYLVGSRSYDEIVTNIKELKILNSLPIKQDTIKWAFSDKIYYYPRRENERHT